jgi:hypothetical protein
MKNYAFLFCLTILTTLFYNCSSDNEQQISDPLHGTWYMKSWVGGGIVHVNEEYSIGQRTLIVNSQNNILTFIDNVYPENISHFSNHTHHYSIVSNENGALIIEQLFYENETFTHSQYLAEIIEITENLLILKEHTSIIPQIYTFEKE